MRRVIILLTTFLASHAIAESGYSLSEASVDSVDLGEYNIPVAPGADSHRENPILVKLFRVRANH